MRPLEERGGGGGGGWSKEESLKRLDVDRKRIEMEWREKHARHTLGTSSSYLPSPSSSSSSASSAFHPLTHHCPIEEYNRLLRAYGVHNR